MKLRNLKILSMTILTCTFVFMSCGEEAAEKETEQAENQTGAISTTPTEELDEEEEEVPEEEEVEIVDEKVEVSCPECAQSLRVPSDYEGSVRCPACEHIFKAND